MLPCQFFRARYSLLSYAVDLGTEIQTEKNSTPEDLLAIKIVNGFVQTTTRLRQTKTYLIKNRSPQDRLLIIEHPYHSGWQLVSPAKPSQRSREFYRFQFSVPAGKTAKQAVVEEKVQRHEYTLLSCDNEAIASFLNSNVSSTSLKETLKKALELRRRLVSTQQDIARLQRELKKITDDQARVRANLYAAPPASAAYKRFLQKLDSEENDIEKFQGQIRELQATEKRQMKEYVDYLGKVSAD